MASASPGRAQEQSADGLGMRERAAAIIQVNMALHGEGHQPKAAEQDSGSAALPTAPSLLLPSSRPESRPRSSGQTPILSAKAWAAALRTRLAQRGLNAAAPLCGEVVLPSRGASALRGVEAVAASSDNLSHAGLEPHVRAAAEEMLSQAVTGDLASAVKAADDIALMDRRVALSPMPAARFVFPPDKNTAMHLVVNQHMRELTATDLAEYEAQDCSMLDIVHPDDKADISAAFFSSIGRQQRHCYVAVRLQTGSGPERYWKCRLEHQFLQFYPNGRIAAVTVVEDTHPERSMNKWSLGVNVKEIAQQQALALQHMLAAVPTLNSDRSSQMRQVRRHVRRPRGRTAASAFAGWPMPAHSPDAQDSSSEEEDDLPLDGRQLVHTLSRQAADSDRLCSWLATQLQESAGWGDARLPTPVAPTGSTVPLPRPSWLRDSMRHPTDPSCRATLGSPLSDDSIQPQPSVTSGNVATGHELPATLWHALSPFQQLLATAAGFHSRPAAVVARGVAGKAPEAGGETVL